MKKTLIAVAVALVLSVPASVPAKADVGAMTVIVMGTMFVMGRESTKPTPFNLTDACTAQTVKSKDGNYSFDSYDHCITK